MSLSVKEILNIGKRQLEAQNIADAAIDSKMLYCHLMNVSNARIILEYQRILPDNLCEKYFELLDRRCTGEPVQYIIGTQEFMGLEFRVNENVLIPRQDTETLVEDAISIIRENRLRNEEFPIKKKREYDVLDLCCGSGAIGVSLAVLCDNVKVTCSDVSKDALEVARENASALSKSKIEFKQGNLLEPFAKKLKKRKFDLIISNPPYIRSSVIPTLQTEVKDHEPMLALDGGENGLECYEKIISDAELCLNKEGVLMFEIGHDQKDDLIRLLEDNGAFRDIRGLKDLAGRDRIIVAVLEDKKKRNKSA